MSVLLPSWIIYFPIYKARETDVYTGKLVPEAVQTMSVWFENPKIEIDKIIFQIATYSEEETNSTLITSESQGCLHLKIIPFHKLGCIKLTIVSEEISC